MDLAQQLSLLLGDFSHLAPRIKNLNYETDVCGERIDVRCSYISFRDGQPTFDDFIDVLADHVIPFCLPRHEIRAAQNLAMKGDHVAAGRAMDQLSRKARDLFIKAKKGSHRSGEAGEIVLYLLTEWLLQAPQIVSKMYLKTNSNMPVYGTDGIHARYDTATKKLHLYWGESKAHVTLSSALGSALESIAEFVNDSYEKREIEIVSAYADFAGLKPEAMAAFLKHLDPYTEESNDRVVIHSCLLVFEFAPPVGEDPTKSESVFVEAVNKASDQFISSIRKVVANKGLGSQRFEFILAPVPSVQGFRDKFQQKIGWPT
jgi:hypothetical protein